MKNTMEVTVFAKKRNTATGKVFYNYIATLTNKRTGEGVPVTIRFPQGEEPQPSDCPLNILVSKDTANISDRHYNDPATGERRTAKVLWVKEWTNSDTPFVDDSLKDF